MRRDGNGGTRAEEAREKERDRKRGQRDILIKREFHLNTLVIESLKF